MFRSGEHPKYHSITLYDGGNKSLCACVVAFTGGGVCQSYWFPLFLRHAVAYMGGTHPEESAGIGSERGPRGGLAVLTVADW